LKVTCQVLEPDRFEKHEKSKKGIFSGTDTENLKERFLAIRD